MACLLLCRSTPVVRCCTALLFISNFLSIAKASPISDFDTKGLDGAPLTVSEYQEAPEKAIGFKKEGTTYEKLNTSASENGLCLSNGCVLAAAEIIKKMDQKTNPCTDFYQFACGNFLKRTILDDNDFVVLNLDTLKDDLARNLRLMMDYITDNSTVKSYKMAKNLYRACMNGGDKTESAGLNELKAMLYAMGGWPLLEGDHWNDSSFSWTNTTYMMSNLGFNVNFIIQLSTHPHLFNRTRRSLYIVQPSLSLDRSVLVKGMQHPPVAKKFRQMVGIAVSLGADKARAADELRDVMDFQIKLANISISSERKRKARGIIMVFNMEKLMKELPFIPWIDYFKNILPITVAIKEDDEIFVLGPSYFEDLANVLDVTPKRVVANYMFWRMAVSSVPYLSRSVRQQWFGGEYAGRPRWKGCTSFTANRMPLAVGSLYVKLFFNEGEKKHALEMYDSLREEVFQLLTNVDWMDEESRKITLEKAKEAKYDVGFPDEILDVKEVDEFYRELNIGLGSFLQEALTLNKFQIQKLFQQIHKPLETRDWIINARITEVNAYYRVLENSIYVPAGILQGVAYSSDRPNYLNFGAIGFVIGHELTHGFKAREFKEDGNSTDIWTSQSIHEYREKSRCIEYQYGNFTINELDKNMDGRKTLEENIADNGGLKVAYHAYRRWVAQHGVEQRLPGLQHLSPQQLFWVSTASSMCAKHNPLTISIKVDNDPHSLAEFRINGMVSNRPEFAQDFNCPLGSEMNPVQKCQVW